MALLLILSSISVDEESLVSTSGVSKRLGEAGLSGRTMMPTWRDG